MSPNPTSALRMPARDLSAVPAHVLEPVTRAFIDGLAGSPPIYTLTPDAARAVLSEAQATAAVPLPEVSIKDVELPVGPDGRTRIRAVRPPAAKPAGGMHAVPDDPRNRSLTSVR